LITYVIVGWFIGMQRTREPLLIVVFVNSLNIILDWLLIVMLGLNSNGAAIATVVAEYCGLAFGLYLVLRRLPNGLLWFPLITLWRQSSALLQVHGDLLIRTLCLLFAFAFFTAQGARQGDIVLAANAILLQLLALVSHGLDGYAHAAEALVGKACGAGDQRNLRRAFHYTALWSAATALVFTAVFVVAREPLLYLFTDIPAVRAAAQLYFPWLLALPLMSFTCYWLDGVFIGAGKTRAMRNTIIGACFGIFLPLWWILQKLTIFDMASTELNNHGLWIAFLGFNLARGLIMAYYALQFFRSDQWFKTPVAEQRGAHSSVSG
jgi:MATE family multidrug resistance protein